jgi:homoserine O-acetyltransferase
MRHLASPFNRFSRDSAAIVPPARLDGVAYVRISPALGGPPAEVPVHFLLQGDPATGCVAVLGGISATRDPGVWWSDQVGPGAPLDPRHRALLGLEFIGRLPAGWSAISPHDQAAALVAVLDVLGIARLDAAIGASYGGCVVLALAERYPERVARACVISAAHRAAPMTTALRSVQRELLRLGQRHGIQAETVALARALAVTTYRSEAEFARRFAGDARCVDGRWRLPVQDYLEAQGERFAARFCAERYHALSESLDLHRVDASAISLPLHLLAVRQDRLVPCDDIAELARSTHASLEQIDSDYGHDAFLKETDVISDWLRRVLRTQPERRMRGLARVA